MKLQLAVIHNNEQEKFELQVDKTTNKYEWDITDLKESV